MQVASIACGSDFVMCLQKDSNIYGIGQNKSGQLGLGDRNARDNFTVIGNLINEEIKQIYSGNQHCCCIVDTYNSLEKMSEEVLSEITKENFDFQKFIEIESDQTTNKYMIHRTLAVVFFDKTLIQNSRSISISLSDDQMRLLLDLIYGKFTVTSMADYIHSIFN